MKSTVIRFLLWLATKLGHESDLDYRGRILNVMRRPLGWNQAGTRGAIEEAIANLTPAGMGPTMIWVDRPYGTILEVSFPKHSIPQGEQ